MSTWYERLDEAIRARQDKNETSLKRLASVVEQTPSNISHYRKGRRTPDPETLAKLCNELRVSADWLLGVGPTNILPGHKREQIARLAAQIVALLAPSPEAMRRELAQIIERLEEAPSEVAK